MTVRPWTVVLCGYYGFDNLGDELLAEALLAGLEGCGIPRERLAVLSNDPGETARKFGVAAVNRWDFREVWRMLRRAETLLLGGGGLFQDRTSSRSALYYAGVVYLAKRAGCLPWVFGQSVGPLEGRWGVLWARNALRHCSPLVVRDAPSEALLSRWGLDCRRSPDAVFLLARDAESPDRTEGPLLVNVRPWPGDLSRRCGLAAAALARSLGRPVRGVALAPEDEALLEAFSREGILPCETIVRPRSLLQAREIFCDTWGGVGMRLHFLVLCVLLGRSAVAVPYDPKVRAFAQEWGIARWEGEGDLPAPEKTGADVSEARERVRRVLEEAWRVLQKRRAR